MIFAEFSEQPRVNEILKVLKAGFGNVEWGNQGTNKEPDAYFWIKRKDVLVSVDNLTSWDFQIKCAQAEPELIQEVINVLGQSFGVRVYDEPEIEAHE